MSDTDVALQRFKDFQAAMNSWEIHYFPLIQSDWMKHAEQAKRDLKLILDEYVYDYPPQEGRMAGPDVGSPPDHDPERDIIEKVDVDRSKVIIYVQKTTQFGDRFRHTLGQHDGHWIIEKSEIFLDDRKKWKKYFL